MHNWANLLSQHTLLILDVSEDAITRCITGSWSQIPVSCKVDKQIGVADFMCVRKIILSIRIIITGVSVYFVRSSAVFIPCGKNPVREKPLHFTAVSGCV